MQPNPQQSSRSRFKLTDSNPSLVHDNPLNTSTSKMQYSIPKSKRWTEPKLNQKQRVSFYELPEVKSNRSTSFGYGNKIDLSKSNLVTPSPMNYTINGDFDKFKTKKTGITFGAGRDIVKNVNTYGLKPYDVPGPQHYQPNKSSIQLSPPKYSMSSRLSDMEEKWPRSIPGPGQYSTIDIIKNNANLFVSKFESSPAMSFSKNKRTAEYQQKMRLTKVPGPGEYKVEKMVDTTARFYIDGGRSFSKGERKGIVSKSITPGPGTYNKFSQFIF